MKVLERQLLKQITSIQKTKHKSYGRFGQFNSKIWIMDPRMYFQGCCSVSFSLSLFLFLTISIHSYNTVCNEEIPRYIRICLQYFIYYNLTTDIYANLYSYECEYLST